MSDYTPTTEDIRRNNWLGTPLRSSDGIRENASFNRWLAKHTKEVRAKRDQELVEAINELPRTQIGDYILGLLGVDEDALIKGESQNYNETVIHLTEGENK